jgi:engulfment/cell motility protein 1
MRLVRNLRLRIPQLFLIPLFQDNGLKYLHYVDSAVKFPVRNGLEDLPDRIEVSSISEIATGTCAPPPNVLRDQNDLPPTTSLVPSPLSFSLLSAHEGSLADQIAPDQSRWADWTDIVVPFSDLSGEMVEIPSGLVAGPPPTNTDFFFSELM